MVGALALAEMPTLAAPEHPSQANRHVLAMGCYARTYSDQHMRNNPGQTVRKIILRIGPDAYGTNGIIFGMQMQLQANLQTKARIWRAGGACKADGPAPAARWQCQPDTDGAPSITLMAKAENLIIDNPGHLQLFDDRTGPDLNTHMIKGVGERQFLLHPMDAKQCKSGEG